MKVSCDFHVPAGSSSVLVKEPPPPLLSQKIGDGGGCRASLDVLWEEEIINFSNRTSVNWIFEITLSVYPRSLADLLHHPVYGLKLV